MSYCDFNISLFNKFISGKKKIIPALSDDWELIDSVNIIREGVALQSKNLEQIVYDIPMRRYIRFCKMENVTVLGNKLTGEFAVGQDRSIYSKKDFLKWTDKWDKRVETVISVKDAKVGHIYRTVCGLSVIYLGSKYTAKYKNKIEDKKYTKISKVHYVHINVSFEDGNPNYGIQPKGAYKFIRDMGYALDADEIANVFKHYYYNNMEIVYFGDTLKKNPEYGYIDAEPFEYSRSDHKTQKEVFNPYNILFSCVKNKYSEKLTYFKTGFKNTTKEGSTEYDEDMKQIKYHPRNFSYYGSRNEPSLEIEKLCRLGVVN